MKKLLKKFDGDLWIYNDDFVNKNFNEADKRDIIFWRWEIRVLKLIFFVTMTASVLGMIYCLYKLFKGMIHG